MSTINTETVQQVAHAWIDAWNRHDLEAVLSHYADDFELSSPFVVSIAEEPSGTLVGKTLVRAYWAKALQLIPDLHFELCDALTGVNSIALSYRGHRGMAVEVFWFDAQVQVIKSLSCYETGV